MNFIDHEEKALKQKMLEEMAKFPIKNKRNPSQLGANLISNSQSQSFKKQNQEEMIKLYE